MKRHPADLIALIAGLIFVLIGSAYLTRDNVDFGADGTEWLLPLALIGLGIAGLAGSIAGVRRTRNDDSEPVTEPAAPVGPAAPTEPDRPTESPTNHDQGSAGPEIETHHP